MLKYRALAGSPRPDQYYEWVFVAETNAKLIRVLRVVALLFLVAAGALALLNLVPGISWELPSAIVFLGFILVCGLSFGISGLMSENPEIARKLFFEWLIVVAVILIWVVGVYSLLIPIT
jgi:hypothetical protein